MILVELYIENYKHFAGSLSIEFPPEGAVAIIGSNGVGKTTLFETIEWCLYNPRQIPNDEVPPRGGVGDTRVRLTLEDPRDGAQYVIERVRRRRGVDAEIYRADQPGSPIVKGTRDVTEYVRQRLIGLSHRAFVSTFFTRQKELSFFGDLKETDRRREVAQLLGFETIRSAQAIIGEDRTAARNEYQLADRQLEEEQSGRDLEAEIVAAGEAVAAAAVAETEAIRQSEDLEAAHTKLRTCLEHLRELERQDAALAQELERLGGDLRAAEAGRKSAAANLDRLAQLEADRLPLVAIRDTEAEVTQLLLVHEANYQRFHRLRSLQDTAGRNQHVINDTMQRSRAIVRRTEIAPLVLPAWRWDNQDDVHPEPALARLQSAVESLDVTGAVRTARDLSELERGIAQRDKDRKKVRSYLERLALRRREIDDVLAQGNPRERTVELSQARDAARQAELAAAAQVRQARDRKNELARTINAIEAAAQAPECPTCHRPLSSKDAEIAIAPLRAQIDDCERQIAAAEAERKAALDAIARSEQEQNAEQARLKDLTTLEHAVQSGLEYLNEVQETAAGSEESCLTLMRVLGREHEPSRDEVEAAEQRARVMQSVASHRGTIANLREQLGLALAAHEATLGEIASIGDVVYDEPAHEQAKAAERDVRSAVARLTQIERELANRQKYQRELAAATASAQSATTEIAAVERRRQELGFDRPQLEATVTAERDADARARAAGRAVSTAHNQLDAACRERDHLLKERKRLEELARRSEIRRREHDELDRMYREFSRFDQFVAQLVTPQLADYTGELLAEVTDRAYDQVTFDENYGLQIYDGPEAFPIDQFSGGERDVAALCARLALSRFIGSQAAHPPRFLVLDEVFGSLDADRRSHLLNALLLLAGADGPFRQLFIISHVDDVRSSPALDEVWRVREVDGASKVENVSRTQSVEDL